MSEEVAKFIYNRPNNAVNKLLNVTFPRMGRSVRYQVCGVYRTPSPFQRTLLQVPDCIVPYTTMPIISSTPFQAIIARAYSGRVDEARQELRSIVEGIYGKDVQLVDGDKDPTTQAGYMAWMINGIRYFLWTVGVLSLFISFLGIFSMMVVGTNERSREFGLLRVLGARQLDIMKNVLGEAFLYALIGSVLGICLAVPFTKTTLDAIQSFVMAGQDSSWINSTKEMLCPMPIIYGTVAALFASLLAAGYPALRISQVSIITSVHE